MKILKNLKSFKNKALVVGSTGAILASNAMADITVDATTGAISGKLDVTPFMTGAAVILVALGAFWCVKKVIGLFGR